MIWKRTSRSPIFSRREVLTRWWWTAPTATSDASGQRSADVSVSESTTSLKPANHARLRFTYNCNVITARTGVDRRVNLGTHARDCGLDPSRAFSAREGDVHDLGLPPAVVHRDQVVHLAAAQNLETMHD